MAFLTKNQLKKIGFKYLGNNVKISNKASFYNPNLISIDHESRIDDFCVLSTGKGITIGKNVHISVYTSIIGKEEIVIGDFAAISSRVSIYSSNDDYSGNYMTNPTVDSKLTNVHHESVYIGKHVLIGSGCVILPGITMGVGACIGALSLVKDNCKTFCMYAGIPAKFIKLRSNKLLKMEKYIK